MKNRIADLIIVLLKETDLNYTQIANQLSCSVGYVHDVAAENRIMRKSKKLKVLELLKNNPDMPYYEIAELTGYSTKNISAIAVKYGLTRYQTHQINNDKYMVILDYLQNKEYKSFAEVSRTLNVPYSSVRAIAIKNGLKKK